MIAIIIFSVIYTKKNIKESEKIIQSFIETINENRFNRDMVEFHIYKDKDGNRRVHEEKDYPLDEPRDEIFDLAIKTSVSPYPEVRDDPKETPSPWQNKEYKKEMINDIMDKHIKKLKKKKSKDSVIKDHTNLKHQNWEDIIKQNKNVQAYIDKEILCNRLVLDNDGVLDIINICKSRGNN
jgi:hypothetical protein